MILFPIFSQISDLRCEFYGKENFCPDKLRIFFMEQVHGGVIVNVGKNSTDTIIKKADGLMTRDKKIFLAVKVADCVPIFYFEPKVGIIGVVHAGWRGVLINIAGKMVAHIVENGGRAEDILVAVGPHICEHCYQVDEKRYGKFQNTFPQIIFNKYRHINLGEICKAQMIQLGVPEKQIEFSNLCTSCRWEKLYSYRRGSQNERNLGLICLN